MRAEATWDNPEASMILETRRRRRIWTLFSVVTKCFYWSKQFSYEERRQKLMFHQLFSASNSIRVE